MANKNSFLHEASRSKKDEFYTQLEDIEREIKYEERQIEENIREIDKIERTISSSNSDCSLAKLSL